MFKQQLAAPRRSSRSDDSTSDIDMDLAYGELPPPLPPRKRDEELELRGEVSKLQKLLDEANCVQHSATAMIASLQNNPDQLAAVALTMAEISSLASKMAPGALFALKGAFPAVIALLLSPEFLIAAGVGVGVTVIALGGYKIVKKIKRRKAIKNDTDAASEFDELQEINSDLSHIDVWRRGIADAQAASDGTSVDGEFITPVAGRQLIDEGKLRESDLRSSGKSKKSSKSKNKNRLDKAEKAEPDMNAKPAMKRLEPSGLKMLFKGSKSRREQRELEPQLL